MSIDLRMLDSSDGLSPPSSPRASGGTLFNPSSPVVTAASFTAFAASPVSSLPWSIPVFSSSASGSARSNPGPNQESDTQVTPASTQPSTPGRATGASSSTRVLSHSSSLFAVSYPSSSSSPVTVDPIPGLVVNGARGAKKASEKRPRSVSAPPLPVPTSVLSSVLDADVGGAPIIGPTGTGSNEYGESGSNCLSIIVRMAPWLDGAPSRIVADGRQPCAKARVVQSWTNSTTLAVSAGPLSEK